MSRVPRGHGAVEQLVTHSVTSRYAFWKADTQGVDGKFTGNDRPCVFEYVSQQARVLVQRPATEAKAVKANFEQTLGTPLAQVELAATLDDAEQERA